MANIKISELPLGIPDANYIIPATNSAGNTTEKLTISSILNLITPDGLLETYDAISTIEDPVLRDSVSVEWEYAPYIERSHPMLVPLTQSLGLTENDIDRAFSEAVDI